MNIDISNAHCGFRTLSVTHAWPRVARHSNPPGRPALTSRRTGARGRAQPAVGFTPDRSAAASQVASLNVTLADRAGGVALAASPTRPAGFTAPRRHGPSSRRAQPPPGAGSAVGGGPVPAAEPGGPSNDVGVVPALGASLSSARTACVPAPRLAVHGRRGGGRGRIACATSDQVRLPAEFKHISKRRKRN
jgi:hypothetical protein